MEKPEINICWFRRDLRLEDNAALYHALKSNFPVLAVFIFDTDILHQFENKKDKRVQFIYETLEKLNSELKKHQSSFWIGHSTPLQTFEQICNEFEVRQVFANHDYEPYAIERDLKVKNFLAQRNIVFNTYKDQVIYEKSEIVKANGEPYTIFTPYSKLWKDKFKHGIIQQFASEKNFSNLFRTKPFHFLSFHEIGFEKTTVEFPTLNLSDKLILDYDETRNIPSLEGTSFAGMYLRFGTISVRSLVRFASELNEKWLDELIWREFFMMILFHFPYVVNENFKKKYDNLKWRNNEKEFLLWCKGETGYPIVDAGMRQLNKTGWMHNRVRMIVAGFLCKDLLIDWRWGEAYFAEQLLDYELSSNNGNWQWAAGTGCDAAPYFRIFNPNQQIKKFDPQLTYIKRWIKNFRPGYLPEIVNHEFARKRALDVYKKALEEN